MPTSTMPRPAGVNGTAVRSEATRATKKAPLMPSEMSKPRASTTKSSRSASVVQMRPVRTRHQRHLAPVDREDADLEAIVERDDATPAGAADGRGGGRSCAA